MTIRTYQPADRNECIVIFKSNMPLFFAEEELPLLENWLNAKDKGRICYKSNLSEYFYVAEDGSKVIACGGFYIPRNEHRANMVWGMVDNKLHKKGIGKKLLQFRIETIKKIYQEYVISLDTTQHSFKFFEKLGFVTTKVTKDFYAKGLDRYDMMSK